MSVELLIEESAKRSERDVSQRLILISVGLAVGIFIFDLLLPLGVAAGVPYVALVVVSFWSDKKLFTIYVAVAGTVLTLLGLAFSPEGGILWMVLVNRFLAILVIWLAAVLVILIKTKEMEREALIHQLTLVNQELSDFTYIVSHDIKAPFRAIHNYADFLQKDLKGHLEEEQESYLEGLGEAVRQGEKLLEDLLDLSRIGKRSLDLRVTNLGPFLKDVIDALYLSPEIEVVIREDWPQIKIEPTLFRQVIQNLVLNGLKFNQAEKKQIEIGWSEKKPDAIELFVKDNGIGIEQRFLEKIFLPFQRLHSMDEYEGTGIGLAIITKISNKMGWPVRVESELEKGSTFYITLPKTKKER